MVDPRLMCTKHLIGEHGEIHKHRHVFVKKYSIAGRRGQIEPVAMLSRHDELATEMINRGFSHKSPFEQPDISYLPEADRNGCVDVPSSHADLINRCSACKMKFEDNIFNNTKEN